MSSRNILFYRLQLAKDAEVFTLSKTSSRTYSLRNCFKVANLSKCTCVLNDALDIFMAETSNGVILR